MAEFGAMSNAGTEFRMDPATDPRTIITPDAFRLPIITLVSIVALAVVYPAIKAAVISPVDAMRHR